MNQAEIHNINNAPLIFLIQDICAAPKADLFFISFLWKEQSVLWDI
jgi:hypothetical protein